MHTLQDVMQWMADHHSEIFLVKEAYISADVYKAQHEAAVQATQAMLGIAP